MCIFSMDYLPFIFYVSFEDYRIIQPELSCYLVSCVVFISHLLHNCKSKYTILKKCYITRSALTNKMICFDRCCIVDFPEVIFPSGKTALLQFFPKKKWPQKRFFLPKIWPYFLDSQIFAIYMQQYDHSLKHKV